MKILDKYIAKNFIIGYIIAMTVLVGMCIVIDLFLNLDEFAEKADLGTWAVFKNVLVFYSIQSTLYFRNFASVIVVVAAAFSLGKMTRNNELIAVMASGVSLKRVIAPIVLFAILLTGLLVIDQEFVIPRLASQLIRSHDSLPGEESYDIWFLSDNKGALICTKNFEEKTMTMFEPTIIVRRQTGPTEWETIGRIQATKAVYDSKKKRWDLHNGRFSKIAGSDEQVALGLQPEPVPFYQSDITPMDIPLRLQEGHKALLSSSQLATLAANSSKIKDLPELYSQKHFRITDPIISIVMLMVALPVLVCRDPKAMKGAILTSFAISASCFIVTSACKMVAAEAFFGFRVRPELWAWAPIFIFLPIALIELDSMRT